MRHEPIRLAPLLGVSMDFPKASAEHLVLLKVHFLIVEFKSHVLGKGLMQRQRCWRLNPQYLIKTLVQVFKVHHSVVLKALQDVVLY
jgi:hypothetical protein